MEPARNGSTKHRATLSFALAAFFEGNNSDRDLDFANRTVRQCSRTVERDQPLANRSQQYLHQKGAHHVQGG